MTKEEIRKLHKSKRQQLSEDELELLSFKIGENFIHYLNSREEIQHIHIFLPIKHLKEVNTFPFLEKLDKSGYILYTSVLNSSTELMETVILRDSSKFEIDRYAIPVPLIREKVSEENIQAVLIPLLAYDKNGNRLGYGKGYYDRFLKGLNSEVLKIGVSFFPPEDLIPTEWHDIPLDICITPREVFLF
ncbi:5-formyltetrahydrofolate cyclo-ligase [Belliella sp. DSM 107340]|uniref:5-formyltetrahydrofolate cyclo-ligase n=1 Tax=Belliella calami TaxID=2923436 RepID=A0ABS9UPM1_9BACT|nr:5-formyltetrahydrofolate cyclo-ligase [Belliella calami]MCH7398572.1 5-formyltetrahydrofolate cyclo-ligase [Belliella calami]